jgi:hypothetical protein
MKEQELRGINGEGGGYILVGVPPSKPVSRVEGRL